jgi:hypothetical protein
MTIWATPSYTTIMMLLNLPKRGPEFSNYQVCRTLQCFQLKLIHTFAKKESKEYTFTIQKIMIYSRGINHVHVMRLKDMFCFILRAAICTCNNKKCQCIPDRLFCFNVICVF